MRDAASDLRYGFRQLIRTPAVSVIAVVTLALGIGATTAIFSLLDAAMWQRLPVPRPDQLRMLVVTSPDGSTSSNVPSAFFDEVRGASSFSGIFAFWRMTMPVAAGGDVERLSGQAVSGGYYGTLGIRAFAGRLIDDADERDRRQVVVVSHEFWRRRFAGEAAAIGRIVEIDGSPMTVVGVTPPGFFGTDPGVSPDLTIPLTAVPRLANLWVTGRLKPEVADERARIEADLALRRALDRMRPGLANYRPRDRDSILAERAGILPAGTGSGGLGMRAYLDPLRVLMLLASVALLAACVNVANLLLARSAGRARELSVRVALGASRVRLIRQLLAEHAILAIGGGAAGVALAFGMHRVLVLLLMDADAARALAFSVDAHVLTFCAVLTIVTLLTFGVAPALRATRADGRSLLQRTAGSSRGGRIGMLKGLIVVEVASAVLLLFCASLLLRTFHNLSSRETGIGAGDLLMMRLGFGQRGYSAAQAADVYDRLAERLAPLPGVESVAFAWDFAFASGTAAKSVWAEGQPPELNQGAAFNVVGPGFFSTAGIPLVAGREFSARDRLDAPKVVIVNEAFARRYFSGLNPIGRHVGDEGARSVRKYEVVGVVKDTRSVFLRRDMGPVIYQPLLQDTWATSAVLHVRTRGDAARLQARVRSEVRALDARLPVYDITTLDARRGHAVEHERAMAVLSGFFGALAVLLTALGVYGVIGYAVGRRRGEIGVRLALGATAARVRWTIVRETTTLMAIGVAIGVPLSFVAAQVLKTSLFGVATNDPLTAAGCAIAVLAAGAASGYLPARRAAAVSPTLALRAE